MNILAIETSFPHASIALSNHGDIVERTFHTERKQNVELFPELMALKLEHSPLDLILIGTGPGSYSGTRIALAAAQGLALATDAAIVGMSSFLGTDKVTEALSEGNTIQLLGDARRGSWFRAECTYSKDLIAPDFRFFDAKNASTELSATHTYHGFDAPDTFVQINYKQIHSSAKNLLLFWLSLSEDERQPLLKSVPQPTYLRPPFITKAKAGHPLLRKIAAPTERKN